jgi:hypothetical protein
MKIKICAFILEFGMATTSYQMKKVIPKITEKLNI